jgi:hypothetical protein
MTLSVHSCPNKLVSPVGGVVQPFLAMLVKFVHYESAIPVPAYVCPVPKCQNACMVAVEFLCQSVSSGLLNHIVRLPFYPRVLWCMRHYGFVKHAEAMPILLEHSGHRWEKNLCYLYHLVSCFTLVAQFLVFYGSRFPEHSCSSRPHNLPRVIWM